MATWRHLGGTLLGVLIAAFVLMACTSEPSAVVIEDTSDATAAGIGELTPFAERLYGSSWEVIQAQLNGEALVAHWRSPVELGTFSFYGTRKALSVSVNHECGSATAPIEITDDRIVTDGFIVPVGCEHLAVFEVFAQPKIAAAFNGLRLELTGDNVSLAAEHFLSTSDNGTAPLYVPGDPYVLYQTVRFQNPSVRGPGDAQEFTVLVSYSDSDRTCQEHAGVLLEPQLSYDKEQIRLAVPAVVGHVGVGPSERVMICYGPTALTITLDEPRDGRPLVIEDHQTRPATPEEIEAAVAAIEEGRGRPGR